MKDDLKNLYAIGRLACRIALPIILILWAAPLFAALLSPQIEHGTINLTPYGNDYSMTFCTFWKNRVYVSGQPGDCMDEQFAVDVTNPDNPTFVASAGGNTSCQNYGSMVVDDKLYVASWYHVLNIYDVSNPSQLTFLGTYFNPGNYGWQLYAGNNRAYITQSTPADGGAGISIFDVSNPATPTLVSSLTRWGRLGGIYVRGSYLYYANDMSVVVVNISDETNPQIVNSVNLGDYVGPIQSRGNYLYAWALNGLHVIDISDPLNPVALPYTSPWYGPTGYQMCLFGDYAWISTIGNEVACISIADPSNLYLAAQPGWTGQYEASVTGNGRYLYVGAGLTDLNNPAQYLHTMEVFSEDPDDTGPGNWKNFTPTQTSFNLQCECDALPSVSNPAWTVLEGSESYASVSTGTLRINDTGTTTDSKVRWSSYWNATNCRGTTVMARAKCASYNLNGSSIPDIIIEDGRFSESFAILSDKIKANNANVSASLDGTQWHIYRITTLGTQFKVYVDEAATPVLIGTLSVSAANRSRISFGSDSGPATQDISYDYFYAFDNGAQGPSTVTSDTTPDVSVAVSDIAGKGSLSGINPSSAGVQWSTDGGATWTSSGAPAWNCRYEADALPTVSVPNWSVAEGSESYGSVSSGELRINDNSTASGSKIKWSRQWNANPSVGTTILTRAKCASTGGDTSLLGNIFVEDGSHSEFIKIMTDRIVAANSGLTKMLTGTQYHVYRVTTKNNLLKVYVDENATPVISETLTASSTNNRVMFGSGASAATQDITFDYFYYTNDGEFLPGQGNGGGPVTVSCTGTSGTDKGVISASGIPFNQYSQTKNRIKFSLKDMMGNTGVSPAYVVQILGAGTPGPVTNFTATSGAAQVSLSWTNPTTAWFTSTTIRYKTSGYPTSPTDGTLLCESAAAPGSNDSYNHTGLGSGAYYYAAFAHDEILRYSSGAIASATPGCTAIWLNENFDGYVNGNLGGNPGWTKTGAADAQVESTVVKLGKSVLTDSVASGGISVADQLTFDQRSTGYYYFSLDVAQDAAGTTGQEIGYVSFQAADGSEIARLHVQKSRLMMEFGGGNVVLSTSAANLTWYNIKIGFNVDSRNMDLWLDAASKGTGFAWKGSGTNLAKIVVGSDRNASLSPQKMYIDNLLGEAKPTVVAAVVDDGAWTPSLTSLHFSFDPAACAGEYRYAIGTTSGGTQARGWTSCGQATDVMATGLSLTQNSTYYVSVQVGSGFGTWGQSTTSNGIKVASAIGILAAKGLADGTSTDVKALRAKLVSANCTGGFYVQEPGERQGVKVVSSAPVAVGDQVDVCGIVKGSGAERYLDCTGNPVMKSTGPGGPDPVVMSASALGGTALNSNTPGVVSGIGPNNIGLLVSIFGKVTQRQTTDPKYFYVDDGSGLKDGTMTAGEDNVGVRVIGDPTSYAKGTYLYVTGVVSCFDSSGLRPEILPASTQILRGS